MNHGIFTLGRTQSKYTLGVLKAGLAILALGIAAETANAQVSGGFIPGGNWNPPTPIPGEYNPGYNDPRYPGYRPPVGNTETVRTTIGRQYQGFTQLNVSQIMSMVVQGREILSLSVRMSAQGGRSHAILLENGQAVGQPVIVPNYTIDADFYVERPNSRNLLELNLNGPVYIQEITATVASLGYPGRPPGGGRHPQIITEHVGQAYFGNSYLNIDQLLQLHRYHGSTVRSVIIRGSSRRGRGTAELMINGFGQRSAVTLGTSLMEYRINVPGPARVGYDIQSLDVELNGNIFIESVTVELRR